MLANAGLIDLAHVLELVHQFNRSGDSVGSNTASYVTNISVHEQACWSRVWGFLYILVGLTKHSSMFSKDNIL